MRQFLQHRLKTNIIGGTGQVQPRGNYVNTRGFQLQNNVLRAIAGWTGQQNCASVLLLTELGQPILTEAGENLIA